MPKPSPAPAPVDLVPVVFGSLVAVGVGYILFHALRGTPAPQPTVREPPSPKGACTLAPDDIQGPGFCVCVPADLESRCQAIRLLVRVEEVQHVADRLIEEGGDFVSAAVKFVARTLAWTEDPDWGGTCFDQWCSPRRLLQTRKGDCDDHAILLTTILLAGGVWAQVVIGHRVGDPTTMHAWVEGRDVGGFFAVEPQDKVGLVNRTPWSGWVVLQRLGDDCLPRAA